MNHSLAFDEMGGLAVAAALLVTHQVFAYEAFCSVAIVGEVEPSNYRVRVSLVCGERPLFIVDDVHV